jgi:hypothetical protein
MDRFFIWFRQRMLDALKRDEEIPLGRSEVVARNSSTSAHGLRRIELLDGINGKILEIAHRKSHQHEWETALYIVKDDEALADAIAVALVVTGGN